MTAKRLKVSGRMKEVPFESGASYGWIIDRELVTTPDDNRRYRETKGQEGLPSRSGWVGPRNIRANVEKRLQAGEGQSFKMYDDDGNLYYVGRYLGPDDETMFRPLDDLGTPDAGATRIDYKGLAPGGGWATL